MIEISTSHGNKKNPTLKELLSIENDMNVTSLFKVILETTKVISNLHDLDFTIGPMGMDQIFVQPDQKVISIL